MVTKRPPLKHIVIEEIQTRKNPQFTIDDLQRSAKEQLSGRDVKKQSLYAVIHALKAEGRIKTIQEGKGGQTAIYQRIGDGSPLEQGDPHSSKDEELNAVQVGQAIIYYIEHLKTKVKEANALDHGEIKLLKKQISDLQGELKQERQRASHLSQENEKLRQTVRNMTGKTVKLGDIARVRGAMKNDY